jgi:hypothetical protein
MGINQLFKDRQHSMSSNELTQLSQPWPRMSYIFACVNLCAKSERRMVLNIQGKPTYEIATSIQKYLEMNGIYHKLLTDVDFKQFQLTIDAEMKRKACEGINIPVRQADAIQREVEDRPALE